MKSRRSLLLIDDDREFRRTIKEVFEESGYRVVDANDAEQAIARRS